MKTLKTDYVVAMNTEELVIICKLLEKYLPAMDNQDQSTTRAILINLHDVT
ncbi:MAG: hypothetical protein ACFFC7_20110 [Candidatus Hermodarchaeota archaeon]